MREAFLVFLNGVGGVFLGMAVLYGAIRVMSWLVGMGGKGEAK
ncbi:Oxaloacetate decarboxylase, gamma chain [Desulfacinum hydrothermale DSM 13146]|uniref:Oxaloacetate decarboxylase, gamma chain n=1 Tax=Desulfacinum hydrothermale DSM 13146 TaxID=1121390 RepID=A0A1W1X7J8_9BACT|nr:OadG family protein [Desulfacinum hydrothermale]SMC19688.1 Oxaloacetate decarboxylase, gamma chain [Desulfacinum hydrothermale DSM 13146]